MRSRSKTAQEEQGQEHDEENEMPDLAPSFSKMIQVNATDVYLIGGADHLPLLAREYAVGVSTLRINIQTVWSSSGLT